MRVKLSNIFNIKGEELKKKPTPDPPLCGAGSPVRGILFLER
jgi:hypothetical protein